jgi:hypothetical protein
MLKERLCSTQMTQHTLRISCAAKRKEKKRKEKKRYMGLEKPEEKRTTCSYSLERRVPNKQQSIAQKARPVSISPPRVRLRLPDVPLLPGRSAAQIVLQPSIQSLLPRQPDCVGIGSAVSSFVLLKLT